MNNATHLRNLRAIRSTVLTGEARSSMSEDMGNAIEAFEKATRIDHLDVAYLSMGAITMLDADNRKAGHAISRLGYGQVEFISEMLDLCMPVIVKVWAEVSETYDAGVWVYEVSEPLGMWFVRETVRLRSTPKVEDITAIARKWATE